MTDARIAKSDYTVEDLGPAPDHFIYRVCQHCGNDFYAIVADEYMCPCCHHYDYRDGTHIRKSGRCDV